MDNSSTSLLSKLLDNEALLFEKEYERYYIKGESKPKTTGAPFLLKNPSSDKGILLIHGLMAAPEEVREWAEHLYAAGYTVYSPRLSGHGTSAEDLSGREYKDWLNSVDRGYDILKTCCSRIVIGGFSTGAGLALYNALRNQNDYDAVISVSAPLKFRKFSASFVEVLQIFNKVTARFGIEKPALKYATNHPDNPHINYHRCPVKSIAEVRSLMRQVYRLLSGLEIPSLIIQGKNDPKVDDRSGKRIFKKIGKKSASYSEIEHHEHGIIRGAIGREVFAKVSSFLKKVHPDD